MKLSREIDYMLLATAMLTVVVGVVAIYSVSFHSQFSLQHQPQLI